MKHMKISERTAPAYRAALSAGIAKKAIETHTGADGIGWQDWAAYNIAAAIEDIALALQSLLEDKAI